MGSPSAPTSLVKELWLFQRVVDTLYWLSQKEKKVEWYVQVESEMRIERDQEAQLKRKKRSYEERGRISVYARWATA